MKRFIGRVAAYLILLLALGSAVTAIASYFLGKSYFYKPNFIVNYLPTASHFDYVIAGSSRGLTTIDTEKVDQLLEKKGVNISMDDTGLPSQVLMIKHFFESGHQSDFCVLTLDLGHMESSEEKINDNDYRFVSYSDRPYVWEYFKKYEKGIIRPLTLSRFLPVIAFSYYNLELFWSALFSAVKPTYMNRFDSKGNYFYPDLAADLKVEQNTTVETELSNPILEELEYYLKSKNSKLIIYIAPYLGTEVVLSPSTSFEVINHSAALESPSLFYDLDHVNSIGREKATELFSGELKKK